MRNLFSHPCSISRKLVGWTFLFSCILAFSIWIRWINLSNVLFFGFEQGRDALLSQEIWTGEDLKLIGPKTDLDGVFHGVYWFYIIAPFYGLFPWNPVVLAYTLSALHLFSVLAVGGTIWLILRRLHWTAIGMVLASISYEQIVFSRWISNVNPAAILIPVAVFFLVASIQLNMPKLTVLSALIAGFASQFQIGLLFPLTATVFMLLISKTIKLKPFEIFYCVIAVAICFFPLLAFNLRHEFQSIQGATQFIQKERDEISPFEVIRAWVKGRWDSFDLNLGIWSLPVLIALIPILAKEQKEENRPTQALLMFYLGLLAYLPFRDFSAATHLQPGYGMILIILFVLALEQIYQYVKHHTPALKHATWVLAILPLLTISTSIYNLETNQRVFYKTIQDDLRLDHQVAILDWIRDQSNQDPYHFEAYTIPYFQPQGWEVLRKWQGDPPSQIASDQAFVVVEQRVDPYWESRWISELGPTEPISEVKIGELRAIHLKKLSEDDGSNP